MSEEPSVSETNNRFLKILLPVVILAAGALVAFLMVSNKPTVERRETTVLPPLVRTLTAEKAPVKMTVEARATVEPRTATTLVAEVAGRILSTSPSFAGGGTFRKGETLVQIDTRDYELAVEQARAQVAQAEVALAREEAEAELALREWKELGGQDGREAPPLVARKPQLAEARSRVEAAEAQVASARLALSRTRVSAPYRGRVRMKRADVGQYVNPGTPLADVYAADYVEVELPVPMSELAFLDLASLDGPGVGPKVWLSPAGAEGDGGGRRWEGRLVRVAGEVDPQTRMLPLIARVEGSAVGSSQSPAAGGPAASLPLTVGLFVDAEIEGETIPGVVELPRSALRGDDRVLVVDDEGRLRFREVEVLRRQRESVFLSAGIEDGEKVCISPLETPVDGMKVRLGDGGDEAAAESAEAEAADAEADAGGAGPEEGDR